MPVKAKQETKETAETIREMFKAFGARSAKC